ncbi:Serine/threonine-protein kinase ulk1, partial [Tulasnella sp. 408]
MHHRATRTRIPKRAHARGGDTNAQYNEVDISTHKHTSEGNLNLVSGSEKKKKRGRQVDHLTESVMSLTGSPESHREHTGQSRRQPSAKRLKLDDEDNSGADASSERSTDSDADSASHQLAPRSSDDLPAPGPSPQPAAQRLKPAAEDASRVQAPSRPSSDADAEAESAIHQLASGSSDDAWRSSLEDNSESQSSPGFVHCGYLPEPDPSLQPAAKTPKLDDSKDRLSEESILGSTGAKSDTSTDQLTSESSDDDDTSTSGSEDDDAASNAPPSYFPCGYLDSVKNTSHVIHLQMDRFGERRQTFTVGYGNSCEIRVVGRQIAHDHCVIRLKIKSKTGIFLLKPKFVELNEGDLIRFGKGPWFRCRMPEFHQLYCEVERMHGGTEMNSTVTRVRRGHDGVECVAKAITADQDGMAVTEILAYESLGRHSSIVRLLESFHDESSKIHRLVLEPATTDLSRFVARVRAHNQADLRVAAPVWTKEIASAVKHVHSLGMSHRDMKPKNILVFVAGAEKIKVKLADFGLVRLKSQPVESNCLAGTPGWMAPVAFRQYHEDRLIDCYG